MNTKTNIFENLYNEVEHESFDDDFDKDTIGKIRVSMSPTTSNTFDVSIDGEYFCSASNMKNIETITSGLILLRTVLSTAKMVSTLQPTVEPWMNESASATVDDQVDILSGDDVTVSKYKNGPFFQLTSNGHLLGVVVYKKAGLELKRVIDMLRNQLRICQQTTLSKSAA